ncbi:TRAF3-interacting protein 1 isoform X1 [Drosophila sulfurigaster albostrigata]|uniref:TRAF3-interacting protein 1 isoform X1 n=2 Tax=Drosophila sulfurigaster albostrigata TaxID=89887 RepID=UPI002D21C82B|nr:TRAF3-interacting protein 1 isoform X1 [Drosophila sulfurigaster albostrigata]
MRFLQKMIDITKLTTKLDLKVRTSKIVAGHEARQTNELLQAMASVAEQQLEWREALKQVLEADEEAEKSKPPKVKDTKVSSKQISPAGKEREKRISPQEQKLRKATELASRSTPPAKEKVQRKSKPSPDADAKPKLSRQSSKKTPSPALKPTSKVKQQASTESDIKSLSPAPAAQAPIKPVSPASSTKSRGEKSPPTNAPPVAAVEPAKEVSLPSTIAAESLPSVEPESRKSSGKSRRSSGTQRQPVPEAQPTDLPKATSDVSEASANTSPTVPTADSNNNSNSNEVKREREGTFTRENSKESNGSVTRPRTSLRPPSARPASARPGAPRRRNVEIVLQPNDQVKMSGINVKLETFGDFDDDGENLVIIEDANAHDIEAGTADPQLDVDAHQGRLVQQILETQKELVQQGGDPAKEEQQKQNLGARQSSARQMNDLRDIIQTLTKSVNPLGKLMDFIPEDIDAMQLELTMWRDTYTQAAAELKRERSLTASATEPMKQQLLSTESSIVEYKELIDESRHKIMLNNERILKMLMEQ